MEERRQLYVLLRAPGNATNDPCPSVVRPGFAFPFSSPRVCSSQRRRQTSSTHYLFLPLRRVASRFSLTPLDDDLDEFSARDTALRFHHVDSAWDQRDFWGVVHRCRHLLCVSCPVGLWLKGANYDPD